MKKVLIVILVVILALTAACKKKETQAAEPAAAEPAEAATAVGGWTPSEDFAMNEERQAIFEKGTEALLGVDYVPVAYLGSQVVAGTNHVFLVRGTMIVPSMPVSYALAYMYQDLSGNVKLMNIADLGIVPNEDGTVAPPEEGLMGGWNYVESPILSDQEEALLKDTLSKNLGASYEYVAYLGEQLVSGLNRCVLCQVTPVVPDAKPHYALVYVYQNLQGEMTLNQVIDLDVGAFCEYGE